MLQTVTFDTHQLFEVLQAKGYTKQQAEGFFEAIKVLNLDQLATKSELNQGLLALRTDMNQGFEKLSDRIDRLEMKMTIKLGSMMFIGFGAMATFLAIIKFYQ